MTPDGDPLPTVRAGDPPPPEGSHLLTDSRRLAAYVAGLTLTGGDRDGEPFAVLPWERRFLRGAFGCGVSSAALSLARGNGKTALVAGIACGVVDPSGPMHGRRREVVVVASSFAQARIVFEDVVAMLRERLGKLPGAGPGTRGAAAVWRLQDSVHTATLEHRETGARVRCIGSDPRRAHGLRPVLVLADEPADGQLPACGRGREGRGGEVSAGFRRSGRIGPRFGGPSGARRAPALASWPPDAARRP